MAEFSFILWSLWWRRNQYVFKNILIDPNSMIQRNQQLLQDLLSPTHRVPTQPPGYNTSVCTWMPPPQDFCKISWDVAVDKQHCKIGIGIVVRDEQGNFMASMRKNWVLFPDPSLAEALAALTAVKFVIDLGMRKVVLECDSKKSSRGSTTKTGR